MFVLWGYMEDGGLNMAARGRESGRVRAGDEATSRFRDRSGRTSGDADARTAQLNAGGIIQYMYNHNVL